MSIWGRMSDDEREDFINRLDIDNQNNDRKFKRHIVSFCDMVALASLSDGANLPSCHSGDLLLLKFYSGKEAYGCK